MPSERSDGIFNAQKKPFIPRVSMNGQYIAGKHLTCCTAEKGGNGSVNQQKHCTFINVKKH
ncbi:TPA: glutaredoxin [Neisseria gonorrhoeae]